MDVGHDPGKLCKIQSVTQLFEGLWSRSRKMPNLVGKSRDHLGKGPLLITLQAGQGPGRKEKGQDRRTTGTLKPLSASHIKTGTKNSTKEGGKTTSHERRKHDKEPA